MFFLSKLIIILGLLVLFCFASVSGTTPVAERERGGVNCPQYHTLRYNDPSGPLMTPDGIWHVFPINMGWGHCTSKDLLHWDCNHPSTGWNISNTGGITVTSAGYFALQANNWNVSMAKATGPDLNVWEHHGVIGIPADPHQASSLSDTGRAIKLASGWYLPVGTRGRQNQGGGIHWFRADDDSMTHIVEKSFLFTTDTKTLMECPDVFQLGDKVVILGSFPGVKVNTEGTSHWWVGTISDNDLNFTAESTGRFDYGKPGFSSIYAAKSGTSAQAPFTRRVLFGFAGWREHQISSCGGFYVLPRDLSLSPTNILLQHPAVEMKGLRQGLRIQGPNIAPGGQIEVLVQCQLPPVPPTVGVLGLITLRHGAQYVQVGYDFGNMSGFAKVPSSLGAGTSRTDRAPLQTALQGNTVELHVFVDGQLVETFFNGETSITTATSNLVPSNLMTSSFVNTANLHCNVSSWVVGLSKPPSGWTPTYCESCENNPALKDLGINYGLVDCIDACVKETSCKFVNYAEVSDRHCVLFADCKNPSHHSGCDPSKHEWWTTWNHTGDLVL